jgi:hypothetical protein
MMGLLRGGIVAAALIAMLVPQMVYAVNPSAAAAGQATGANATVAVQDVALQAGGVLQGQVLDVQGRPVAAAAVTVMQQGQVVRQAQSDASGRFSVAGLKGGLYQIATAQGGAVYRAWTAEAAPPAATNGVLIVNGDSVVRGGMNHSGPLGFLANPWVLGAIVAAAIAIPLALHDDDDAS